MKKNQGFTLLEILIAALIFSLGFLALATLQAKSLYYSSDSLRQTQIINITRALAEEIALAQRIDSLGTAGKDPATLCREAIDQVGVQSLITQMGSTPPSCSLSDGWLMIEFEIKSTLLVDNTIQEEQNKKIRLRLKRG